MGYARAVDRYKRSLATLALVVNGPGNQFLAGAALATHQDGRLATSHLSYFVPQPLHRPALAHQPQRTVAFTLGFVTCEFTGHRGMGQQAFDLQAKMVGGQWFGEKIIGTGLKRLYRLINRAEGSDDDKGHRVAFGLQLPQYCQAVAIRQSKVRHNQVRAPFPQAIATFLNGCRTVYRITIHLKLL